MWLNAQFFIFIRSNRAIGERGAVKKTD